MNTIVEREASSPAAVSDRERHATQRVALFGVDIDVVTMPEAVSTVRELLAVPSADCHFVVTPNVDHIVMLQERSDLRDCYRDAALVLADGWPIVTASRLLGRPLPERVAGSDLVPSLFAAAVPDDHVTAFLLGAAPGVAEQAAEQIQRRWPAVRVVGTYSPPLGFEHDAIENQKILNKIGEAAPSVLVVGLGAPKQELWVHQHRQQIQADVALCVGATIDFLAGHRQRAPVWMQRIGLEWLHRLLSEPRRMAGRYGRDAIVFPQLVVRQWLAK
jgi:N-acetylglucosaminyldiphosphoundecaprenol N-acetyl-beta-D-mannosaminyltransferase